MGFPGGSVGKRPPANTGDTRSIPELGTPPWRRKCQLYNSCLGYPKDRGALWDTIHEVTKRPGHDLETKQQQLN